MVTLQTDQEQREQLVARLEEMALLLELAGESSFSVKAYQAAVRSVEMFNGSYPSLLEATADGRVPGIGKQLAAFIGEAAEPAALLELRKRVPSVLQELVKLQGVGSKKARTLHEALVLSSVDDLSKAIEQGRLASLKGFGEKSIVALQQALEFYLAQRGAVLLDEGWRRLQQVQKANPQARAVGELRRACPIIRKLQVVGPLASHFASEVESVSSDSTIDGIQLLYATGPEPFLRDMERHGSSLGFELNPRGLYKSGSLISCGDERKVFSELRLPYIIPELRDLSWELACASAKEQPLEESDIRGAVHLHTTDSDGAASLEEMLLQARASGLEYMVVSDHSQSAVYAGGLSPERVREQHRVIEVLNEKYAPFRIFRGIESDILGDGSLDYDDRVLASFDVVICSIHSRFKMSREEMTQRVCTALSHPSAAILGHSCGRLLLQRPGYELDYEAVFATAVKHGVALEINANPKRLDLDWQLVAQAKSLPLSFPISTDAHSPAEFGYHRWGVLMARKAGLTRAQVLNAGSLQAFETWLRDRKS